SGRSRMWIAGAGRNQPTQESRAIALAQLAVQTAEVLWIEDMSEQRWSDAYPLAFGEADHQFYAAAPIILPEGRRMGVLAIFDDLARAYDSDMAERLGDHHPPRPHQGRGGRGGAAGWCRRWPGRNSA